jgi:hypothetical protein
LSRSPAIRGIPTTYISPILPTMNNKQPSIKFALGMLIVFSVIYIAWSGYEAGQWLHQVTHK